MLVLLLFLITYRYFILLYLLNILSSSFQNKTKSREKEFSVERTGKQFIGVFEPPI